MRILFWTLTLGAIAAAFGAFVEPVPPPRGDSTTAVTAVLRVSISVPQPPAKSDCAGGCSVGNHPITPLSLRGYHDLLRQVASESGALRRKALETLLFHGPQVRELVRTAGTAPLVPEQDDALRRELARTHARVWFRVVDEDGVVRAQVDGARFRIGTKEHVHVDDVRDLPSPEISGTVHRTGLHHLWTRI